MGAKEILASVLVSVVAISAIGYVGLPILFPALESTDLSVPDHTHDPPSNLGIVLQSKFIEISTQAGILDNNDDVFINVPDTSLNLTIRSQSRIFMSFNTPYILGVGDGLTSARI